MPSCTESTLHWTKTRNYVYQASRRGLTVSQIQTVLDFLEQTFPDDLQLVRSIVFQVPRILRKDVHKSLEPTVDFLKQLYGGPLFQEAIQRNPKLLLLSGVAYGGSNPHMDDFLRDQVGLSTAVLDKLKRSAPFLFQLPVEKVQSVTNCLARRLQAGGCPEQEVRRILRKVLSSHPSLMSLSVPDNLEPRLDFLVTKCGLGDPDVVTLIRSSPGILGLSVSDNLGPTLDFLSHLLSDPRDDEDDNLQQQQRLRKCIVSHPQLLALSLDNLSVKVQYLNAIDPSSSHNDTTTTSSSLATRVALRAPAVYSLSLWDNLVPKVEFLARVWGAVAPAVRRQPGEEMVVVEEDSSEACRKRALLADLLKEYPNVLTLSLEGNIQPTLNFFNRTGYTELKSDWTLKTTETDKGPSPPLIRGRYIAASLFHRLLPRWHHLIANGWELTTTPDGGESKNALPPLHLLVAATDRAFCQQMGFDLEGYVAFKKESAPRLKFSSQFDTWLRTGRPIDETV